MFALLPLLPFLPLALASAVPAPAITPLAERGTGPFTVRFRNAASIPVSLLYQTGVGFPQAIGLTATTGVLAPAATTTVVYPTGWAGALVIGQSYNPQGSRFEGSFVGNPAVPSYDVSNVDGFSVPIVCGCNGQLVTGCNKPLFKLNQCPNLSSDGTVCLNPRNTPNGNGPATPFFAPCQHASFAYPNDTDAIVGCSSNSINCCIGPKCNPSIKQSP